MTYQIMCLITDYSLKTLDNNGSNDIGLQFDRSVLKPFLNTGFSNFTGIRNNRKTASSPIGFAKIRTPPFKDFHEFLSIPVVFVTSLFFSNLSLKHLQLLEPI